jgi:hypothetical protein
MELDNPKEEKGMLKAHDSLLETQAISQGLSIELFYLLKTYDSPN